MSFKFSQPLLSREAFLTRLMKTLFVVGSLVMAWLFLGMCGYHWLADLGWVDSLLNASMIMSGMGPVDPLPTSLAKLFASIYAIVSGVVFLAAIGLVAAPVVHRFLHHFHLQDDDEK